MRRPSTSVASRRRDAPTKPSINEVLISGMSDQVNPLHVQRFQRALDGIGQVFRVASTDFLGRAAMPRQIQR
jgi:hypothetical protein